MSPLRGMPVTGLEPWLNHPGAVNPTHGASPFPLPRVITLVMLKSSETGSSHPSPHDWGTEGTRLIRGGSMDTREEHDSGKLDRTRTLFATNKVRAFRCPPSIPPLQFLETN